MQVDEKFVANLLSLDEAEVARLDGADAQRINDLVIERHKKTMLALGTALESEDDLGRVVRGHIHVEHELQQIIFFAAPNPDQVKSFERQEFSEKVRLALLLGLRPDLASPLSAAGNLRNKFAHKLDMTLNQEIAKTLIATLPPKLKARSQTIFSDFLASPAWRAQIAAHVEARLGRPVPQLAALPHPFDIFKGEARTLADARLDVSVFFICLLEELTRERHQFAIEKIERMKATAAAEAATGTVGDRPQS
jgi:hypothetical protein